MRPDKGYTYLSEQVCHHPPISACYCESIDYSFWTEVNVKSRFWGQSLDIHPMGGCHVSLKLPDGTNEHYTWKKVTTSVNLVGIISLDHYGDMEIINHRTKEVCLLTFKLKGSSGWFSSSTESIPMGTIVGKVKNAENKEQFVLSGSWCDSLKANHVGSLNWPLSKTMLWKKNAMPANPHENFNYTKFALTLNQCSESLKQMLPLTDSRLRPDQTAMEKSQWALADKEKERLEVRQRTARKQIVAEHQKTGIPFGPQPRGISIGEDWWVPRWFVRDIDRDTKEAAWRFTHEYWEIRESNGKWPEFVTDIFGILEETP